MLNALASVPVDGEDCRWNPPTSTAASIRITGSPSGSVLATIFNPSGGRRAGGGFREIVIDRHEDMAIALANLWREVRDADVAA
jgi:hypothetical protein